MMNGSRIMDKIGCKQCKWKGYTKHGFWNGDKEEVSVTVCSACKDTRGYHHYVKQKYGKPDNLVAIEGGEYLADVIDYLKYKEENIIQKYTAEEIQIKAKKQVDEYGIIPKRG